MRARTPVYTPSYPASHTLDVPQMLATMIVRGRAARISLPSMSRISFLPQGLPSTCLRVCTYRVLWEQLSTSGTGIGSCCLNAPTSVLCRDKSEEHYMHFLEHSCKDGAPITYSNIQLNNDFLKKSILKNFLFFVGV